MATPKDFFEFAKRNNAEMVDLKFVDLPGRVKST
jgi:glutamine synthetase